MDVSRVGKDMLDAAAAAAAGTWTVVQHDFAGDLENVLRNAALIEAKLTAGTLDEDEAEEMLKDQSRVLFVLSQEAIVKGRVAAQNAINAAIDVLWTAVKAAAKI
jgi:hypothetical protein